MKEKTEEMVQITTEQFIGKSKTDSTFHIIDNHTGVMRRRCSRLSIKVDCPYCGRDGDGLIIGKEITCAVCKDRQYQSKEPLLSLVKEQITLGGSCAETATTLSKLGYPKTTVRKYYDALTQTK